MLRLRSSSAVYGPERGFLELEPALRTEGVDTSTVMLYRRLPGGPPHHPLSEEAGRCAMRLLEVEDRARFSIRPVLKVARLLRSGGFDVLQTHGYKADLVGLPSALMAGCRSVAVLHGLDPGTSRALGLYERLDMVAVRGFDRLVAVSDHVRSEALGRGLDPFRIVTVPNALDAEAVRRRAARPVVSPLPGVPGSRIAVVGRLAPEKDHATLLAAARTILGARPDAAFLLVGDGPSRAQLEGEVAALGLSEAVHFLGYREDVPAVLAASSMLALPSRTEPFGRVLIEAMAVGLPVVAARVGGVPEVVEHGVTGLLVAHGDSDALACAVLRVLGDRALAARLGEAGRARVAALFDVAAAARRYAAVYRDVLRAP